MATLKQKTAFKKTLENIGKNNPQTGGQILIESGYSPAIAKNPQMVFDSKGFQHLLARIDDGKIVEEFYKIVLQSKDARAKIAAGKEILTLKDRYPATRTKVQALFAGIGE